MFFSVSLTENIVYWFYKIIKSKIITVNFIILGVRKYWEVRKYRRTKMSTNSVVLINSFEYCGICLLKASTLALWSLSSYKVLSLL